jgi:hypothetical protein
MAVRAFIEFVRSTPLLIQLFFLYYALPDIDIVINSMPALVIGLGVHYGTYCSEAYRAGIDDVPRGQWEASTALNLGGLTTWTSVILPQAIPDLDPRPGQLLRGDVQRRPPRFHHRSGRGPVRGPFDRLADIPVPGDPDHRRRACS